MRSILGVGSRRSRYACAWTIGLLLLCPPRALAQSAANVLLVVNDASPASIQIGQYYAGKRQVSPDHIVHIRPDPRETVTRAEYTKAIEEPIANWITAHNLEDDVLYVVLTKGVPLRVAGTGGLDGSNASVDSELTVLYRKLLGVDQAAGGRISNPYFLDDRLPATAKPFTRFDSEIYLVTRLDGFSVEDVLNLIDRGLSPSRDGKIVLDQKATVLDRGGDAWLQEAADRLKATDPERVVLEKSQAVATATGPVMGYFSWGSNDPANQLRRFGLRFANGAIGGMFVSTDGRTFQEPPADWKPSDPNGRGPKFGGGFQSLAGDLIRDGITGIAANVDEPFLDAIVRPQILFPVYLRGFNLAEAFYLAMPYLSWQTVVIGDPLCAPFGRPADATPIAKGLDAASGAPALYAERRVAILTQTGLKPEAARLTVRFDELMAQDHADEAEGVMVRAAALDARLQLRLALFYEKREQFDKAIVSLRKALTEEPRNVVVLNNLAFDLAAHAGAASEALPLAQKAASLSADPSIFDTLGWIQHLLGDDRSAATTLGRALAAAPKSVEILIHAAVVHAGLGDVNRARIELGSAEALDPSVSDRPAVKALRDKIGGRPQTD